MGDKRKRTEDNRRIEERFYKVPIKDKVPETHDIPVSLSVHEISRIDDWIMRQRGSPARAEAIRILVGQALDAYDLANRTKRR